eukprot:gene7286-biopygen15075
MAWRCAVGRNGAVRVRSASGPRPCYIWLRWRGRGTGLSIGDPLRVVVGKLDHQLPRERPGDSNETLTEGAPVMLLPLPAAWTPPPKQEADRRLAASRKRRAAEESRAQAHAAARERAEEAVLRRSPAACGRRRETSHRVSGITGSAGSPALASWCSCGRMGVVQHAVFGKIGIHSFQKACQEYQLASAGETALPVIPGTLWEAPRRRRRRAPPPLPQGSRRRADGQERHRARRAPSIRLRRKAARSCVGAAAPSPSLGQLAETAAGADRARGRRVDREEAGVGNVVSLQGRREGAPCSASPAVLGELPIDKVWQL